MKKKKKKTLISRNPAVTMQMQKPCMRRRNALIQKFSLFYKIFAKSYKKNVSLFHVLCLI